MLPKEIKSMKFLALTLSNFRHIREETTYQFDDITYISGDNETGKTTIAHGISYALYGCTVCGDTKQDALVNQSSDSCTVKLSFMDQHGEVHEVIRVRECVSGTNTIYLNQIKVPQKKIDEILCEKDLFLSMFNRLYLIHYLSVSKGRELICKLLPRVSWQETLHALDTRQQETLKKEPMETMDVGVLQKKYKAEKKKQEQNLVHLNGQRSAFKKLADELETRSIIASKGYKGYTQKQAELCTKLGEGIDFDAVSQSLAWAKNRQAIEVMHQISITALKHQQHAIANRRYQSPFNMIIQMVECTYADLSKQYMAEQAKLQMVQTSGRCPECQSQLSPPSVYALLEKVNARMEELRARAEELSKQKADLEETNSKADGIFEKNKDDDLNALQSTIKKLESGFQDVSEEIGKLEQTLAMGGLSSEEYDELETVTDKMEMYRCYLELLQYEKGNVTLQVRQLDTEIAQLETAMEKTNSLIDALAAYAGKESELKLRPVRMPSVELKLTEVLKTTCEQKPVFRFTYKGQEYHSLSLSRQLKCCLEVAELLRRLSNIDCPSFIDNSESIAVIDPERLPAQYFIMRAIPGKDLAVQCRSKQIELSKAG